MGFTRQSRKLMDVTLIFIIMVLVLNSIQISGLSSTSSDDFDSGRRLTETGNSSDDTVRIDPLDHFKKYRGGYDITNKHYWSSTAFTGIYGYAIGVFWLLCGILYGGFLLATTFCCKNGNTKLKKRPLCHYKLCYLWPLLWAILFTILAIIASGIVLGGNAKFHSKAKTIIDIIIDTADDASDTLYNATGSMRDINSSLRPYNNNEVADASRFLTSTSRRLDSEAAVIERQARKNRRAIDKGLTIVFIVTTIIISLNLIAVITLSVLGILKFQRALNLFIILCWLLTALCWLLFGAYFFIENFAEDTCTALENFQEDPYNNSLSSILPCDELRSAEPILYDVKGGIYDVVNEVNRNISNAVRICNPFSEPPEYQYQPENCPANTIRIGDIPQLLKIITCTDADCIGGIYISVDDLKALESFTTSIQNLLNTYPNVESLVQCQTVRDAFSEILQKHCKPVKRDTRMTWVAMLFLSVVMVGLVLTWTIEAHHAQEQHSSDGSVKPHSTTASEMESGTGKTIND